MKPPVIDYGPRLPTPTGEQKAHPLVCLGVITAGSAASCWVFYGACLLIKGATLALAGAV